MAALAGSVLLSAAAGGCSSTRDKAAKFAAAGNQAFEAKGLQVSARSRDVQVVSRTVISDANGTAAVVGLRNTSASTLRDVPISVVVADAQGHPVYRNNAPGLERGLVSAPVLPPGRTFLWVDDQVQPSGTGKPATVTARVGRAKPSGPVAPLRLSVPKLTGDPTSGISAVGLLSNTTRVAQKGVIISAVATKGSRVVAAGRAIVPLVAAGKKARFAVYFIGDPRGARLSLTAPPTVS